MTKEKLAGELPFTKQEAIKIHSHIKSSGAIVGHYLDHDLKALSQQCEQVGLQLTLPHLKIDTISLAEARINDGQKLFQDSKLGSLCQQYLGKEQPEPHNALTDAFLTA